MFKSKVKNDSQNSATTSQATSSSSSIIDLGTVIEGTVRSSEDIRLDGAIVGDVYSDKKLVMGETGKIEGTVKCKESSIKGKIEGEISVKGLLHLLNTAFIKGKIIAKKMIVDEGAAYNGECLIGEQHFK